uniref:Uncharacterized protein n=2 Tax=Myxococcus fulvus TaxID=33 RepID=B0YR20_MYXFU|nr:hypothetical protein pMF1.11 [Myxococcus fulvus]
MSPWRVCARRAGALLSHDHHDAAWLVGVSLPAARRLTKMAKGIGSAVVWIFGGVCALLGTLSTFLPAGALQQGADKGAQLCEANGFTAYPRGDDGKPLPRPDQAEGEAEGRYMGVMPLGRSWVPVLVPAGKGPRASSTVEDVGPAE